MSSVIELSPLTRVEGHGRIRVFIAGNRVEQVQLSLYESPRLFESLLKGKHLEEVPEIICRICSLCSTVHRVTALLAVEKALGITVSRQTNLYRELILNGGHIQSHALHLFCLVLPDLYQVAGFPDLARQAPGLLGMGLRLKGIGNYIQEAVGGRLIHPVTLIVGGMGKPVERNVLLKIRSSLEEALPDAMGAVGIFAPDGASSPPLPRHTYLAVDAEGHLPFFGTQLRLGQKSVPADRYTEMLREDVREGTNAKWSTVGKGMGITGAVSRLNLGLPLEQRAASLLEHHRVHLTGADMRANSLAQAIEVVHCMERCMGLIDELLAADFPREPLPPAICGEGSGCAVMEAPRGVLIHSYTFDDSGYCTAADVITPTAINQAAMEADLLAVARAWDGADEGDLRHSLEIHVRAFDPCISCAVHVLRT